LKDAPDADEGEYQKWSEASCTDATEKLWVSDYEATRGKSSFTSMGEDDEVLGLDQLDGGEMGEVDS
jgi:hypothetical protein